LLARAERYERFIEESARAVDVDSQLLRAVIVVESAFDERAISSRGACGLMQLMPVTARRYGARDAFNPGQNIRAGARYLRDLIDRYDNDLELVLAAYNAGEEAVERYGRTIPPFSETRAYVPRVLGAYTALRRLEERT
jgi:soluble lytic murein transglycosylase-like protein